MSAPHLVLVGLPGAGKTCAGAIAARALGRTFVDLDRAIEEAAGLAVPEIFAAEGEAGFRARERTALLEALSAESPAVIAAGGGAVLDPANREAMRARGLVVALEAPLDVLARRITAEAAAARPPSGPGREPGFAAPRRPLLAGGDLRDRLAALAGARAGAYAAARHHRVDTDRAPEEVARAIAALVQSAVPVPVPLPVPVSVQGQLQRPERRVDVPLGGRAYPVLVVRGDAAARTAVLAAERFRAAATVAVVADAAVTAPAAAIATALRAAGFSVPDPLPLPAGEAAKTLDEAGRLADALVAGGLDRGSAVVAVGGGAACDLAGFTASILFRGVAVAHVPTTLLAQLDASVGGKTAVNRPAGKNVLGTFHQPRFVVADVSLLATLPLRELRAGLAEALKCGAIRDGALFELLERCEAADLGAPDLELLLEIVARSVAVKAALVAADEREEHGPRHLLNFGHTFGHAIEAEAGPDRMRHGEAVALGMALAARAGERLGASEPGLERRLRAAAARLGLPDDPDPWVRPEVLARLGVDKKREGASLRLVLVRRPGEAAAAAVRIDDLPALVAPPGEAGERRPAGKTL